MNSGSMPSAHSRCPVIRSPLSSVFQTNGSSAAAKVTPPGRIRCGDRLLRDRACPSMISFFARPALTYRLTWACEISPANSSRPCIFSSSSVSAAENFGSSGKCTSCMVIIFASRTPCKNFFPRFIPDLSTVSTSLSTGKPVDFPALKPVCIENPHFPFQRFPPSGRPGIAFNRRSAMSPACSW